MQKKEVLELTNRFKKDKATFSKICGCYVDANKNKVSTYRSQFLTLEDEEYYKYLEIAKKSLSGKIGNNLIELDIPLKEEEVGGRQQILMALRDSDLEDDNLLNVYYDLIIDSYDRAGNYLIVLFLDSYDVPTKTKDNMSLDESEEVYKYLICSICPVDLAKPALGYRVDENRIGARIRDWVVGVPESAFLFPTFNDRTTDIHSVLFYTKNTKEPHSEFMANGLGCDIKHTSDEKKMAFTALINGQMGEENESVNLDVSLELNDRIEEHEEKSEKGAAPIVADKEFIEQTLKDSNIPDDKAKKIAEQYTEVFEKEVVTAEELMDSKLLASSELVIEKRELEEENMKLKKQLDNKADASKQTYTAEELKEIYATEYDKGSDDVPSFIEWLKNK